MLAPRADFKLVPVGFEPCFTSFCQIGLVRFLTILFYTYEILCCLSIGGVYMYRQDL